MVRVVGSVRGMGRVLRDDRSIRTLRDHEAQQVLSGLIHDVWLCGCARLSSRLTNSWLGWRCALGDRRKRKRRERRGNCKNAAFLPHVNPRSAV